MSITINKNVDFKGCDKRILEAVSKFGTYHNVTIISGKRTEKTNTDCKGQKNSQHLIGLAVDLYCPDMDPCKVVTWFLENYRIGGYGINVFNGVVHIDFRPGPITKWVYNRKGEAI